MLCLVGIDRNNNMFPIAHTMGLQQFQTKHKGLQLKDSLWRVVLGTSVVNFNNEMKKLKACNLVVYDWMRERPPMNWAGSHFNTWIKCDLLLNNLYESFNHVIMKAQDKSIIIMPEIKGDYDE